jgi:hypothetical protein
VPERSRLRFPRTSLGTLGLLCLLGILAAWTSAQDNLPRFTEEREAAALFFVKKNLPNLLPLLDELKKADARRYETEISEIFQVTEYLANLRNDPRRHELELKIWVTESKAHVLVARLLGANPANRKQMEAQLQNLARELVGLDAQILDHRAEQLEKELAGVKDELTRLREQGDKRSRERYESLVEKSLKHTKKK